MNAASLSVSVILCTFERTADLLATLGSIRQTEMPDGLSAELIVVDSSRTDETRRALHTMGDTIPGLPLRVLHEPRRGKAHALNTGIAAARGEVLLFTDDDVRVPRGWIEAMVRPILSGEADAVAGGIHLAPGLHRPWMEGLHRAWMASTDVHNPQEPESLIGANMAFGRRVLERVPLFDTDLGAGSDLGGCDESLFSFQLRVAGYRIVSAYRCSVEHHFDPSRLERKSMLARARIEGRSWAYIVRHWKHESEPSPARRWVILSLKFQVKRWIRPRWTAAEGAPAWQLSDLQHLHYLRQYLHERRLPPKYTKHGLVKVNAAG